MIDVDEALERLAETGTPLDRETVPLREALHRVAAEEVSSPVDLPPFAQSAMDGFALRGADTEDASTGEPVRLEVLGEIPAGESGSIPDLEAGQAVRVFTGSRVPEGADTVARKERVRDEQDTIYIESPIPTGKDLRPVGEELEEGEVLVESGERLDEKNLAALSMTGHSEVAIHREPRITVLVSGDEVVPPSAERGPGEIYDANTPFLRGLLERLGYSKVDVEPLADDETRVRQALESALDESDLVVSTGGVAVGDYDFLHEAAEALGAQRRFWQIDQKPGRPAFLAERDGTPYFGLPGNPGAVFVNTHVYLKRLLDRLEGASIPRPHFRTGRLAGPIERSSRRLRWSPCRIVDTRDAKLRLDPIDRGRAHRMGRLFRADALAPIDPGEGTLRTDAIVEWVEA